MRRKWVVLAVAAAVATACGVTTESEPRVVSDESVPFGLLLPNAPTLVPPASAPTTEPVTLFFIAADRLAAVERRLDSPVSVADVVTALAEPPDGTVLRSAVGSPFLVAQLKLSGGVVQVDLDPSVATLGGDTQLLAIAQIVCTLTGRPGIGQVSFTLAGSPIDVPRGDGTLTSGAVSRDDYVQLVT